MVEHDLQKGRYVPYVGGQIDFDPVDVRVMDERGDIGVVLGAHVYALEPEVQADLLYLIDAASGGGCHSYAPGAFLHVLGHVYVRVVSSSAVRLVVYDEGESGQVVPSCVQVV